MYKIESGILVHLVFLWFQIGSCFNWETKQGLHGYYSGIQQVRL